MSDYPFPPSPDPDSRRPEARRNDDESPAPGNAYGEKISLEEMMERLQRSSSASSGASSGSGESRSGRRRRSVQTGSGSSDSSRRSSSSTSRSSSSGGGGGDAESTRRSSSRSPVMSEMTAAPVLSEDEMRARTVLPAPRQELAFKPAGEKRRNFQDQAHEAKSPKWPWFLLGAAVVGGGIWFGIQQMNRWRVEGDGFKVNASRRLSELLDRRVTLSRFRQTGSNELNVPAVSVAAEPGDLFGSINVAELTAEFAAGSWLADDWTIRSVRLQKADIDFVPAAPAENIATARPKPVDRGPQTNQGMRLSLTSDPAAVAVESGRFDSLNLSWPSSDAKPEFLTGLNGNFKVLGNTVQMETAGGTLDTAAWPPFPVRQINAKLTGTKLEIVSARLGFTEGHEVRLSGSADLSPSGKLELKADITPILLKHILPDAWLNTAMGTFDSTGAEWKSSFRSGPAPTFSGPFKVKGLALRGMAFVDKVADLLRKPDLALMEFPTVTGNFVWTPQGTQIGNVTGTTQDGLLKISGRFAAVPGDMLAGEVIFEASEAFFAGRASEPSPFVPSSEGWRTLTVKLSGLEGAVTDDIAVATPSIIKGVPTVKGIDRGTTPPAITMPRLTLPEGVQLPPRETGTPASGTPAPSPRPAAPPSPRLIPLPPAAPSLKEPSPEELKEMERQFHDLLGR